MNAAVDDFLVGLRTGIERLTSRDCGVLIAVSGGPDSVALLHGWARLAAAVGHRLCVGHFDHQWRQASAADADFVAGIAARLSLPFLRGSASESTPRNETQARKARYRFLANAARQAEAQFVAVGHTSDDQIETVLFSILRGSGLRGLGGIPETRSLSATARLVRPMLGISRTAVEGFLETEGIASLTDPSNSSMAHTRNRIRNELLPALRERFNPRVGESLLRLADQARSAAGVVNRLADELLTRVVISRDDEEVALAPAGFEGVELYLIAACLQRLLERQRWPRRRIGYVELRRMVEVVRGEESAVDLPDGLRIERQTTIPPAAVIKIRIDPRRTHGYRADL